MISERIQTPADLRAEQEPWPAPVPFTRPTPPPLNLADAIPSTLPMLRDFIATQAEALQVQPDAVALLSVGLASLAAARTFEMELRDGWRETAPLWVAYLGIPGEGKSTVLAAVSKPVYLWQSAEREHLRHPLAAYAEERRGIEARMTGTRAKLARVKPSAAEKLAKECADLSHALENMPELPAPVLISANVTPEAARDALAANGEKLALLAPEMDAGQLMGTRYATNAKNAKNSGANVDLFLSAWIGEPCSALRVGRSISLERPALAMILAVQPVAMREVLRDPIAQGRGMIDRFLFVQPPSRLGSREMEPPPLPDNLRDWWADALRRVLDLPWPGRVILTANGPARSEAAPRIIRPDAEAAACFLQLRQDIEIRMRPDADLAPLAGFASKMPGQIARIALAFHVLENPGAETLGLATMQAACAWAPFLFAHARAVRGDAAESETVRQSRRLLAAIQRHRLQTTTARDCLRLVQGESVPTADACKKLIEELVERGFLRELPATVEQRQSGRPPSPAYAVNPATHGPIPQEFLRDI